MTVLLAACASAVPPSRTTPPPTATTDEALHVTDAGAPPDATGVTAARDAGVPADRARSLEAMADRIAARVSRVRHLGIRRPIERGVIDRAHIVERLRARVNEEYPPGDIEAEGVMNERLGLIPAHTDYPALVFGLLEEQVAGFYDPDLKRLWVADWIPDAMQAMTLSHEITHALQDQHFDIARFTHHARGEGDRQLAATAVVEGDATLTMMLDAIAGMGADPDAVDLGRLPIDTMVQQMGNASAGSERLASAPAALRETLLFPYREGLILCVAAHREGRFDAIDAMLRVPPVSTEQVLHAEKRVAHEMPVVVEATVPAPLASTHRVRYDDVMGEFGLRQFLEPMHDSAAIARAAAGWGGDRAVLLVANTDGDANTSLANSVLVWTVVMDDVAHAQAFARAAQGVMALRHATDARVTVRGASAAWTVGAGRVSALAQRGRTVVLTEGAPAASVAGVVAGR